MAFCSVLPEPKPTSPSSAVHTAGSQSSTGIGSGILNSIRAKAFYSAPANYGSAYTSIWDGEGRERNMGVTMEEFESILKEKGVLYE